MGETYYITTPIYYVNDVPHIGTAYTTVAADVLARYHRLSGREVMFLTGVDEHGQKVAKAAEERGKTPQEWADEMVVHFLENWELLNISNDDFIRTSEDRHKLVAQSFIEKLKASGDIYAGGYEGWYCVHDESFLTSGQLEDGNCPDCHRKVEWVKEENYFFRMSKYADAVQRHIEENPDFVQPEAKRNEILNFLRSGVNDQSISRTSFTWGIPLPFDPGHVMYVWFDALLNYVSAIDFGVDEARFNRTWPADLHLVGKEILRFHAVIWPAMLMAARLPLPRRIYAHGWLTVEGEKMSKSLGNVVLPKELVDEYGTDAYRYYFLREFSFGADGNFSRRTILKRYNAELANDLGNLESRVITMVHKYREGVVPEGGPEGDEEVVLREKAAALTTIVRNKLAIPAFNGALAEIWEFIHAVNRYVDVSAPWSLAKDPANSERLDTVLYAGVEGLRQIALLIAPFLPGTAEKMWERLGIGDGPDIWEAHLPASSSWGGMKAGATTTRGEALFPRKQDPEKGDKA